LRAGGLKVRQTHFYLEFHGHHDTLNAAKACALITYRSVKNYPRLNNVLQVYGEQRTDKEML
ncbi:DNA polymerase III subunit epsilon, partial [Staphylococcus pseudintermedius]